MSPFFFIAAFVMLAADEDKKTVRTWKAKCASCHGAAGDGKTEQGIKSGAEDMTTAAWQSGHSDEKMKEVLNTGFKREKNGKKQEMEAYGKEMTPEQLDALIKHIRSLKK